MLLTVVIYDCHIYHFRIFICILFKDPSYPYEAREMQTRIGLHDKHHKIILKLSKRMESVVHLNIIHREMRSAEEWFAGVYSAGGFYNPHLDALNIHDENIPMAQYFDPRTDNRLATILAYHTDVVGGFTVFDQLGIAVKPTAGSALFWYNLHHDGIVDERLQHSACPTVLGTKWISNKWIWGKEQVWRRPCDASG